MLLLSLWVLLSCTASGISLKRGLVADGINGNTECRDPTLLRGASWFYDYDVFNKYIKDGGCSNNYTQQFVPMHWCIDSLDDPIPPYVNTSGFLLGFNEPNNLHNCNKSPETVAKAWAKVMSKFPDAVYVSPATAGDGRVWFEQFFGNCTQLYGSSGCRIKHMAVHHYSCDPHQTLQYLKELHERWKLPLWLTEFACGDHAHYQPVDKQMDFMKQIVPMLEADSRVFRYSWFSNRVGDARALLKKDKSELTSLGQLYNSL